MNQQGPFEGETDFGAIPPVRWYVDPKSGHILREKYQGMNQQGPFEGETDFGDWRAADGLTMPYKHENKQNGQATTMAEFKKIELNTQLDPKHFAKPDQVTGAQQGTLE